MIGYNETLTLTCILLTTSRIMPELNLAAIERAAASVPIAELGMDLGAAGARIQVAPKGSSVTLQVTLGFPLESLRAALERNVAEAVRRATGIGLAEVRVGWKIVPHAPQGNLAPLPGARNVVAIASGKGGVGKSTTAVNFALALAREGARVGVLDADVYGPSQPLMLGLSGSQPQSRDGKTFEPLTAHGLEVISIGFLVQEARPVIWRGPMVTQAITQLTFQTNWHDLDYLVVDLPPGTGDSQLTLTQKVPLAGVIIVTTPQQIATQIARRGLKMFDKVAVAVLGVIENMSSFQCPKCGHEESLFGEGGGERLAAECGVPFLGRVPLNAAIRAQTDAGRPPVVAEPDGAAARRYGEIARKAAAALAQRPRDQKHKFPRIVVEDRQ
jgi:ATP-binding protein involved in chromosome partitioning